MTPNEKASVRAILIAAKVKRSDIDWMVESCPDIETARARYSRSYRPPQHPIEHPPELYDGVTTARDRLLSARRSNDDVTMAEAFAQLQTEIAIVYWRMEQAAAGVDVPALPASTVTAIEALP